MLAKTSHGNDVDFLSTFEIPNKQTVTTSVNLSLKFGIYTDIPHRTNITFLIKIVVGGLCWIYLIFHFCFFSAIAYFSQ